jgi:hypothetical protein
MMIHKRRGGGLGWNYAGLAAALVLLAGAFALVAEGAVEFAVDPWTLLRLPLGALIFAVVVRAATRRRS